MPLRFVAESMKVPEPEIEVVKEGRTVKSKIKYPAPNPADRADEEYTYPEEEQEYYDSE